MRDAKNLLLAIALATGLGGAAAASAENPLAGTRWELVAFGDAPVVKGSVVTLEFGDDGRAGGSGGCNRYGGEYRVDDGTLAFRELTRTLMACADEAATEQESRYLRALESATAFEVNGEGLTITCHDGGSLNFRRR